MGSTIPTGRAGRRSGASAAPMLAIALAVLLVRPPGAAAQACTTDTSPDHDDWHAEESEKQALRAEIEAAAADRDLRLSGTIEVSSDTAPPRTEIEYRDGFEAPASFLPVVRGLLSKHLMEKPLSERSVTLRFDLPPRPLWPDSTVHCEPAALNDNLVRGVLRALVLDHPGAGTDRFPDRDLAARLWLFVDVAGRVTRVQVDRRTRDGWYDRHLEEIGRTMRFRPASLNGVPIGVWVSRNVRFNTDPGPRGIRNRERPPL